MPAPDVVTRILAGEPVEVATLSDTERADLLADPRGRRWLRGWAGLDPALAEKLLDWSEDFATRRRDASLERVVELAPPHALEGRAGPIASGPAASMLWRRLAGDSDRLTALAERVVAGPAAESTLAILVVDPLDEYGLGIERRVRIARAALASSAPAARGLAVEYLSSANPDSVISQLDALVADDDERVRGVAWLTALRVDATSAFERVLALLADESAPIEHRRSALVAAGMTMPTDAMADVLAAVVVHPDERLALDAADLLYARHRNPLTAEAARFSPHGEVREIAEALLDPRRGSPAAGGSRPGDPTRTLDIFKTLLERSDDPGADGASRR